MDPSNANTTQTVASMPEQTQPLSITTFTTRSVFSAVLQTLIKPLRPRLTALPKKKQPAGSPKLSAPSSSSSCRISERQEGGLWMYDFTPEGFSTKVKPKQHLYYFAGGGFQAPPASEHWKIVKSLAIRLRGTYLVTLVSYPLALNTPAHKSIPMMQSWLKVIIESAKGQGMRVTLAGDSAGGNVVLCLGFLWAAEEAKLAGVEDMLDTEGTLSQVLAISPACDMLNTNPAILETDRFDATLTKELIEECAKGWIGNIDRKDPRVSPVYADLDVVRRAHLKVHGIVATWDVLAPDALRMMEELRKERVEGDWLVWERQMHCFPLAACYGHPEGRRGLEWMIDVLKRNA